MQTKGFHFGEWLVDAQACTVRHEQTAQTLKVEPRAMDVLLALCGRAGQIVSADDLLHLCWDGLAVGENQVHKAITQLRKLLGDTAGDPRYIENIRKRGYRTMAPVTPIVADATAATVDSWIDASPFVGLDAFDEAHAAVFFGRDAAIAQLRDTVAAQVAAGHGLVLVLGPSGSGKTSLVQAGLIPSLRSASAPFPFLGACILDLGDVQGMPLPTALGGALLDLEIEGRPLLEGFSADAIGAGLSRNDRPGFLDPDFLGRATAKAQAGRAVLFIDRLEAVFRIDGAQRRSFFTALGHLAGSGAILVIAACRNDFYPDVAGEPLLLAAKTQGGHFDLAPPTRAEIIHMIRLPAIVAGLRFGTDPETGAQLDDTLCEATADQPDALPLLQYTLHELYLQRSTSRELTVAAYRALGGLGGAIGKRAEATLDGLPAPARAALSRVLSLVVTVGAQDEAARSRRIPWRTLATVEERTLVDTFVRQRLFVAQVYDGEPVFGVAHEAMLRQWPRAAAWIADHRRFLQARSRMEEAARRWLAEGRRNDLLLPRGRQLEEARELAGFTPIPLDTEVRAYIDASVRRERQADRRRLGLMAGFAAIAVLAGGLGLVARQAEKTAQQRKHQAEDLMNFMVGNFADKLRPLGRLELLSDIGEKALSYFSQEPLSSLTPEDRAQQARALQTLAEVARSRADPKSAQAALAKAKSLLDANLAQGLESLDLLKDLGAVAFWMGQISLDANDLDGAEAAFREYERYSKRMTVIAPKNVDAWVELSYALTNLGSTAVKRADYEKAAKFFEAALPLMRQALAQRPNDRELRASTTSTLSWLGTTYAEQGELRKAVLLFDEEATELQSLRSDAPSEFRWLYMLGACQYRRLNLLDALGEEQKADTLMAETRKLVHELVTHDPSNQIWQRLRLNVEVVAGEFLVERHQFANALTLQRTLAIELAKFREQDPANADWALTDLINQANTGASLLGLNRSQEAAAKLSAVVSTLRSLKRNNRMTIEYDERLSATLLILAAANEKIGQMDMARLNRQETSAITQRYIDSKTKDRYIIDSWILSNLQNGKNIALEENIDWLEKSGYRKPRYVDALSQATRHGG
ncbi:winged helix-turn-helix domain-containing protein [Nitrospirillum sp. BR 11828]|uniref:nSTAND1 domain-containing NTPase n=1 Tax=Nitrospirillum sp. BR 11828 TaxID=3104325 RepID=UPI002ACAF7BF|nr:winged helix-turn-helix domain-containing protein [Nitrospirillum sp. BR 11828]MDZ5650297.1 winged helix-turn-helix domain-containing protein [Nitrospirillum sp. BR 11828]